VDEHELDIPENPIICLAREEIDPTNCTIHPVFKLQLDTRIYLLSWLTNWCLAECDPIKSLIDAENKTKGRRSPYSVSKIFYTLKAITDFLETSSCWS
jgi:hypothetical protein